MANSSSILELIPFLPSELQSKIRVQCLHSRNLETIEMCANLLDGTPQEECTWNLPKPQFPWHTPVWFHCPHIPWTPLLYVYLWYLFNMYHIPVVFDPEEFDRWRMMPNFDGSLFNKFWFQVFGEDWRVVASGRSLLHPMGRPIEKDVILIVKLNSNEGRPSILEWVRNERGGFHRHGGRNNLKYLTCQTAIWRAHFLNTGNNYTPDEIATTPEAEQALDLMEHGDDPWPGW